MCEERDILKGGPEGGDSVALSPSKPPSRVDNIQKAVRYLANAIIHLAYTLDEGPLRTKVFELSQAATSAAADASKRAAATKPQARIYGRRHAAPKKYDKRS